MNYTGVFVQWTQHEADIGERKTVIDWFNFCREECSAYLELGGFDACRNSLTVEIDETKYFHRKYHRGRFDEGH